MPKFCYFWITILVLSTLSNMFLMFFGTHMGEKGHRTVFLENLFCTVSALSAIAVGGIWAEIDPEGKKWALLIIVIGSFLFICSVFGIKNILKESREDTVTVMLTDIRITIAAAYGRQLEGMADGRRQLFMLRGADRAIARRLKNSGQKNITVVYHPATHRVESVNMEAGE